MAGGDEDSLSQRQELEADLNRLESRIAELKVLYEQHFVDILPQPPVDMQREVQALIRTLLRAPFKSSALRFRLRTLVQRYATYATYWERVLKQREEGSYRRDVYKAEMREKLSAMKRARTSSKTKSEAPLRELFATYQDAMQRTGGATDQVTFDAFKKSLLEQARKLKEQGQEKIRYQVVVQNGKVVVKAKGSS